MPAAHPPSNHYNATRTEYYRQLEDASESGGDVVPFIRYAMQGFVDGIRQQVLIVWGQQYADRWERFIYETFGGHVSSNAEKRRLALGLAMSAHEEVGRRDIPGPLCRSRNCLRWDREDAKSRPQCTPGDGTHRAIAIAARVVADHARADPCLPARQARAVSHALRDSCAIVHTRLKRS